MSQSLPGTNPAHGSIAPGKAHRIVEVQHPLKRVLAFTRHTIDDVVSDPIAKRRVAGFYSLYRQVQRTCEVNNLERQWNR